MAAHSLDDFVLSAEKTDLPSFLVPAVVAVRHFEEVNMVEGSHKNRQKPEEVEVHYLDLKQLHFLLTVRHWQWRKVNVVGVAAVVQCPAEDVGWLPRRLELE